MKEDLYYATDWIKNKTKLKEILKSGDFTVFCEVEYCLIYEGKFSSRVKVPDLEEAIAKFDWDNLENYTPKVLELLTKALKGKYLEWQP